MKQEMMEWQWHQLGHMQICISPRQITTPAPHNSVFYRPDTLNEMTLIINVLYCLIQEQTVGCNDVCGFHAVSDITYRAFTGWYFAISTCLNFKNAFFHKSKNALF